MTEVMFYHLERQPLEKVLPQLLEKTLARGWRAVVQTESEERSEALSALLWTSTDDGFLPHGTAKDGSPQLQPIWLTHGEETLNDASVRFFVDGADREELTNLARAIFLFDGNDQTAVERARAQWKRVKAQGHAVSYWQQDDGGRWVNRAS